MMIAVKDRLPTRDGKYLPGEEPDDYYDPAWDNEDHQGNGGDLGGFP
jgi:hypothetical protein